MLYARDGDRVLLHGSTGAGALRRVAAGAPAVLTVFALDALVVAPTTFESSVAYRSATIRGRLEPPDDEREAALDRFSETLLPGRTSEVRRSTARSSRAPWPWRCRSARTAGCSRSATAAGDAGGGRRRSRRVGGVVLRTVVDPPVAAPAAVDLRSAVGPRAGGRPRRSGQPTSAGR